MASLKVTIDAIKRTTAELQDVPWFAESLPVSVRVYGLLWEPKEFWGLGFWDLECRVWGLGFTLGA